MGMGIVSDSEFNSELNKLSPIESNQSESNQNETKIVDMNKGRGNGNKEVPNSLRKIIGETSEIYGRQEGLELAKQFGISSSSVSAYAHGSSSTSSYDERPNVDHINQAKDKISKRARNKLLLALSHITQEKLEGSKARDLAGIARDMSAVVKNMEPDNPVGGNTKDSPTFIFYSPQMKKEETFDVIFAKE